MNIKSRKILIGNQLFDAEVQEDLTFSLTSCNRIFGKKYTKDGKETFSQLYSNVEKELLKLREKVIFRKDNLNKITFGMSETYLDLEIFITNNILDAPKIMENLQMRIDTSNKNLEGRTALFTSAEYGSILIIDCIIKETGKIDFTIFNEELNKNIKQDLTYGLRYKFGDPAMPDEDWELIERILKRKNNIIITDYPYKKI